MTSVTVMVTKATRKLLPMKLRKSKVKSTSR